MRNAFRKAWKDHRLMTIGFLILCVISLLLTLRLIFSIVYWQSHTNMPIEPWMRLGYVSRSHHVDVGELRRVLDLDPGHRERRSIGEIAKDRGIEVFDLIERLEIQIRNEKSDAAPAHKR